MPPIPTSTPSPSSLPSGLASFVRIILSPGWGEKWSGAGTVVLALTAVAAGGVTLRPLGRARRQNELARASEHGQTFWEISRRWNDSVFREGRIRIRNYDTAGREKGDGRGPEEVTKRLLALKEVNEKEYWESLMTLDFFETLAMSINYDSISLKMADDVLGFAVWEYWAMLYHFVEQQRRNGEVINKKYYVEKYYVEFEKLANKIADTHEYPKPWEGKEPKGDSKLTARRFPRGRRQAG
jgi:hypothetical protein